MIWMCARDTVVLPFDDRKPWHFDSLASLRFDEHMICMPSTTDAWCRNHISCTSLLASRHELPIVCDSVSNDSVLACCCEPLALVCPRLSIAWNCHIICVDRRYCGARALPISCRFPAHPDGVLGSAAHSSHRQRVSTPPTNLERPMRTAARRYRMNANDPPFWVASDGA